MDTLDFLDTASFRGVRFVVPKRGIEGGRRGDTFEQPHSDVPFGQDTGRRGKSFRVTGWVFTDTGFTARNALIDALDAYGPGRYVDPWGKPYRVKVARWSVNEDTTKANLVEFQVEFTEEGVQPLAVPSRVDTSAVLVTSAAQLWTVARSAYLNGFSYNTVPQFVRAAGPLVASSFVGEMLADVGKWGIAAADSLGISDAVGAITSGVVPAAIADGVRLGLAAASVAMPTQAARVNFLLASAAYAVEPVAVPWQTENRDLAAQNEVATASLIRRASLAELAESTPSMTWDSYEDARAYMHAVGDTFDDEISRSGGSVAGESSSSVFGALTSARAALVSDVAARGATLSTLASVTLPGTRPAVVEAYRQYDDADRAADIVARNGIADPNRMPSGVALEYLSK